MTALSFTDACERIKSGLDIVDIVRRHVILKKTGRNYSGKCPFHNDKSPSMNVSREKGIFKCFACGVGGDALTFLMKIENRTFGELIRELAQEQGIEIIRDGREFPDGQATQKKDARERILALNEASLGWFKEQLATLPTEHVDYRTAWQAAQEAIQNRYGDAAIRQVVLQRFDLGLALPGWENLSAFLKSKFDFLQASPNLLVDAGLASARENGQGHYDRFRNRLIIPIRDDQGRVVAFGARTLSDDDKPKYLNSPETSLYHKNQVLYGLSQAKDSIRQSRTAIVMEGYFDVISAHVAGVTEAVGSCGTALTEQHFKLLTRFGAERVILAFDSDEAGLKAALSAIDLMAPYLESIQERSGSYSQGNSSELSVQVLTVPDGKDPDDFIRQNGGEAFRALIASAKPYLTFQCDMAIRGLALETSEGRIQAATRLTPILSNMDRPTVRAEYLHRYAERIGVSQEALALEVRRHEQTKPTRLSVSTLHSGIGRNSQKSFEKRAISSSDSTSFKRQPPSSPESFTSLQASLPSRQQAAEKNFLRLMLYNPESFSLIKSLLNADTQALITDAHHQEILSGLLDEVTAQAVEPGTQPGTIWEKMNHLYSNKVDILNCLAELALTADEFAESLGLDHLTGAALHSRLTVLAEQQLTLLADCRRRQQLLTMKTSAAANEEEAIALTYEFRDHLSSLVRPVSGTG